MAFPHSIGGGKFARTRKPLAETIFEFYSALEFFLGILNSIQLKLQVRFHKIEEIILKNKTDIKSDYFMASVNASRWSQLSV